MTFTSENNTFFFVPVAMLKQALFNHMMSREAEEETEERKQSGAAECQLSSLPGSPEGPSAASDESPASAGSQKDNPQPPSGHAAMSETAERNGEGSSRSFLYGSLTAVLKG